MISGSYVYILTNDGRNGFLFVFTLATALDSVTFGALRFTADSLFLRTSENKGFDLMVLGDLP